MYVMCSKNHFYDTSSNKLVTSSELKHPADIVQTPDFFVRLNPITSFSFSNNAVVSKRDNLSRVDYFYIPDKFKVSTKSRANYVIEFANGTRLNVDFRYVRNNSTSNTKAYMLQVDVNLAGSDGQQASDKVINNRFSESIRPVDGLERVDMRGATFDHGLINQQFAVGYKYKVLPGKCYAYFDNLLCLLLADDFSVDAVCTLYGLSGTRGWLGGVFQDYPDSFTGEQYNLIVHSILWSRNPTITKYKLLI